MASRSTAVLAQAYLRQHPLGPRTPNSIVDAAVFDRELARVRRRGYAFDQEEFALGVSCIGAPLLRDGHLIAAYGVTMPTERFKRQRRELTATLLDVIAGVEGGS